MCVARNQLIYSALLTIREAHLPARNIQQPERAFRERYPM